MSVKETLKNASTKLVDATPAQVQGVRVVVTRERSATQIADAVERVWRKSEDSRDNDK